MRKKLIVGLVLGVGLLAAAGAVGVMVFTGPIYEPGMVRRGEGLDAELDPPAVAAAAETGASEGYWQVTADVRLYYRAAGSGSPALVLHGGPGIPHAGPWPGLADLEAAHRFYYYHQRGCGRSTRPIDRFAGDDFWANSRTLTTELGLAAQIADIERVRRLLGEERLVLIGHSFGGFTAALYAAEFPERVRALVLVAPAPLVVFPGAPEHDLFAQVRARLPADQLATFDAYQEELFAFGPAYFQRSEAEVAAFNARFIPFYQAAVRPGEASAAAVPESPAGLGGWVQPGIFMSMGMRHDYADALRAVKAPVLVLHGAADLQPEAASRVYLDYFPHAEFRAIPEATHFVCQGTGNAACGEAIEGFLRDEARR